MSDDERNQEALFRHAILGELLSRKLRRGELRPALKQLAQETYQDWRGRSRRIAYKTLEEWYYKYRNRGFEALKPRPRSDRNQSRRLSPDRPGGSGRRLATLARAILANQLAPPMLIEEGETPAMATVEVEAAFVLAFAFDLVGLTALVRIFTVDVGAETGS